MSLLTIEPRRGRASPRSPSRPASRADHPREESRGARPAVEPGAGGAAEFVRLLGATLAFYVSLIAAPMLALLPIAMLGLALGLVGALVGG